MAPSPLVVAVGTCDDPSDAQHLGAARCSTNQALIADGKYGGPTPHDVKERRGTHSLPRPSATRSHPSRGEQSARRDMEGTPPPWHHKAGTRGGSGRVLRSAEFTRQP